ncbi:hypothetical protein [Natrinema caseinilyticum]|uniref:hypothetical protein n=1 Tax=Natrinema caseinilyticum TaxID=2961570 RepID=UPI0020C3E4C2|nr:hypothetical protein [Natrinema caseinilyticum]
MCVVLLVAAAGGIIYTQTGTALEESTENEMTQSTALQANTVVEWVDRTQEKTRYISASDRVVDGDHSNVAEYLRAEQQDSSAAIAGIHLYDTTDHRVLASTVDGAPEVDYRTAGVEWATDGLSFENPGETRVTHPYNDPATETESVAFVSQVPDASDRASARWTGVALTPL